MKCLKVGKTGVYKEQARLALLELFLMKVYIYLLIFSCFQLIAGLYNCSFQFGSCYSQSDGGSSSRKENMRHYNMESLNSKWVL